MLIDAVGGMDDEEYDYYLKYRATGMEKSIVRATSFISCTVSEAYALSSLPHPSLCRSSGVRT